MVVHPTVRKPKQRSVSPDDPWLSLVVAARELGVTRQTVLTRVVAGELVGQRVAGRTVVSRESVERAVRAAK